MSVSMMDVLLKFYRSDGIFLTFTVEANVTI